jgi:hypothetical protein
MNPLKLFFSDTALFLLRLLRHLIIQTIILIFVFVDGHIHDVFKGGSLEKPDVVTVPKPKPPKHKGIKRQKTRSNSKDMAESSAEKELKSAAVTSSDLLQRSVTVEGKAAKF